MYTDLINGYLDEIRDLSTEQLLADPAEARELEWSIERAYRKIEMIEVKAAGHDVSTAAWQDYVTGITCKRPRLS